jgi:hypothetical protein
MPDEPKPITPATFTRDYVLGESEQWPVFSDSAELHALGGHFIHSIYQTSAPRPGQSSGSVPARLVGRYAYSPEHFRELVELFVRHVVMASKDKEEVRQWLLKLSQG